MLELLQERDFSNSGTGHSFVFTIQADALQGDNFAGIFLLGSVDNTISALTKLVDFDILVHPLGKALSSEKTVIAPGRTDARALGAFRDY